MNGIKNIRPSCTFQKTAFGPVAVLWSFYGNRPTILRIVLSKPDSPAGRLVEALFPEAEVGSCAEIDGIADRIAEFLTGRDVRFPLEAVRMDRCPAFQRRVLLAERGIPRGRVSTYQRIARHIGSSRGARAVGAALAANPFPVVIPCHRAVRSDGTVGGYQGGPDMKRVLLEMEGVCFDGSGRVAAGQFFF
jgi:methylated-DNA-[protein]-cysteine S-methyltransferase